MADPATNPIFEQMQFDYDVAGTAAEDTIAALTKALNDKKNLTTNKNEEFIHQGALELREVQERVPAAIEKIGVARGSAKVAAYDMPSVKAHKEEILAAIKQIAAWEKQLLKLDTAVDKTIESMNVQIDTLDENADKYEDWVGEFITITKELAPDQVSVREHVDALHAKAVKAVETRNANSLELAKMDADEVKLKRFEDGLAKLDALAKKLEEASPQVDNETRTKNMQAHGQARGRHKALRTDVEHFKARKQAIKSMKVAPLDIAKAMKTLSLPPAHKAALAKAIEEDEATCIKALDVLAKQAKLAQSGKDMLAALRKAKVV